MDRERVDHWLRLNAAMRTPRRLVILDSEARTDFDGKRERHGFRLAAASFDLLDESARPLGPPERVDFDSPAALWAWVASKAHGSHRTVVFAHNLSYDLRLTQALERLPELGFQPTRVALNDFSCWARFAKGRKALLLCDSLSWLPVPLDRIASLLRMRRPRLPAPEAEQADWLRRCHGDVRVLRAAVLNLLQWVHDDELGDFRPTGHAQASAAFRHRFLDPKTVLVHWDADARAAERRAGWTGRAEVWRPGLHDGPLHEYDYQAAYARIAEQEQLPVRLLGQVGLGRDRWPRDLPPTRSALYECTVHTEVETVPTELDGRICWPIGSFPSTLWHHEAQMAERYGATIDVHKVWLYEQRPALRRWARWVLAGLDGEPPGDDPLRRLVLKTWSRALIGRFGLRYPLLDELRLEDEPAVQLTTLWDGTLGRPVTELQVGLQVYEQTDAVDSPSSTPALMSAVMAHARVRLWSIMQAAGIDHVFYVDTDSILVDDHGAARIERLLGRGRLKGLRHKGSYRSAELRSPRNLDLGDERRIAGVPRHAGKTGPKTYQGEIWESLPASMRRGRPSSVFRLQRSFTVAGTDTRREQLPDGRSAPFTLPSVSQAEQSAA